MAINPWEYADKTKSEHAEQVALFVWRDVALRYGVQAANDPRAYTTEGYKQLRESVAEGAQHWAAVPQLEWLHAIANHGAGFGRKASGVKAGVSDVFLPVPIRDRNVPLGTVMPTLYCGLYIELKRRKGEKSIISEEQTAFGTYAKGKGYGFAFCYGWEAARDVITTYLGVI